MLKELFESSFYLTFPPITHTQINLTELVLTGAFSLLDDKACKACKFVCASDIVNREQLKIVSKQNVNIISIDQIFSYVKDSVGETCDYMLESNEAVALVEMTCSTGDYVVDKRSKARRQLYNTIALLFSNQNLRQHITNNKSNYVIFSWRETFDNTMQSDGVEDIMKDMLIMTDGVYSPDNEMNFDFGFKLKEICYPHALLM